MYIYSFKFNKMKVINIIIIILIIIIFTILLFILSKYLKFKGGLTTYYTIKNVDNLTFIDLNNIDKLFNFQSNLYFKLSNNDDLKEINYELFGQMNKYKSMCDDYYNYCIKDFTRFGFDGKHNIFPWTEFELLHFLIVASKYYNCSISDIKLIKILGEGAFKVSLLVYIPEIINNNEIKYNEYVLLMNKLHKIKYEYDDINKNLYYNINEYEYNEIIERLKINKEFLEIYKKDEELQSMIPKIYLSSLDLIDINDNYKFKKDKLPIIWYLVEKCEIVKETNFDYNIYSNFVFKFMKCLSKNNFWYDDWNYDNFMLNSKNEYVLTDFDVKKNVPRGYSMYRNVIHHCEMFFTAIRVLLEKSLIDNNIKYYNLNDSISWKYALYCFKNRIFSKCINYMDSHSKELINRILNKEYLFDDYLRYSLDKNNKLFNKTIYDLYVKCVESKIIPADIYCVINVKQDEKIKNKKDDEDEEEIKEEKKQITKIKPIPIPIKPKIKPIPIPIKPKI